MSTSVVKFLNASKDFGFNQSEDGSKDVFVHVSKVERSGSGSLREGQRATFDIATERGKQAISNLKST